MSQSYSEWEAASPGAVLVARREALNMSVTDVARHLKLSLAQVEALESGAYERLPGRVFVRGFLINYARLLDIDPQPLLHTIDHDIPQASMVDEAPTSSRAVMPREASRPWPTYFAVIVAVIVGALAVYEFGFNEPPGETQTSDTKEGRAETEKSAVSKAPTTAPGAEGIRLAQDPSVSAPDGLSPQSTGSSSEASAEASTTVTGEAAAATPPPPVPAGQRLLHFRFQEDSWVEVRDRSDKIIFSKLNKVGSSERVVGTPPFKLVVGNARGVRLDYDDTPVDLVLPYPGVTTARLTLQ
jgi:cytoskeleton protein RodZ